MVSWLISILVVFLSIAVVFWLLKSMIKAIVTGIIVLIIVIGLYWAFIYKDISDIRSNFSVKDKVFILADDEELMAGLVVKKLQLNESPVYISQSDLLSMQDNYTVEDYAGMKGDRYRLFIIKQEAFDSLPDSLNVSGVEIRRKDLVDAMLAENADDLSDAGIIETDLYKGRAQAFGIGLEHATASEGPSFLIRQYLEGNLITSPETSLFKNLGKMPGFLKKIVIKKLSEKPETED